MLPVTPLLVAFAQAASFAATFDVFPASAVTRSVRAALAFVLVPLLLTQQSMAHGAPATLRLLGGAILAGAGCGLSASLVATACRAAGGLIDSALTATLFTQGMFQSGGPVSRLYSLAFLVVFLTSGACTRLVGILAGANAASQQVHAGAAAIALARTFTLDGLALAGPVLCLQILASLTSGAVARVAPHVNGMLLSAPIGAALMLACLALSGAMFWPLLLTLSAHAVEGSAALVR